MVEFPCSFVAEPDGEGPGWVWPAGRQGNGVLVAKEICPQGPGCTELHVSVNIDNCHLNGT